MNTVFVVDDEEAIQKLISYSFKRSGFQVVTEANGRRAYEQLSLKHSEFQLAIIDIMLPDMDGFDICRCLRQQGIAVPIILVTARDEEVDRVLGLELGADDYITKPFSPRELIARARAIMRRSQPYDDNKSVKEGDRESILHIGDIEMNIPRHEVRVCGREIEITMKEFELLAYLMKRCNRVLSRDVLMDAVWGMAATPQSRIIDVHISHLREKIERDPLRPVYIRTVRGAGYKFSGDS